jgi:hypothetical protein
MFLNSKLFGSIFDSIMIKLDEAEIKDFNFYSDMTKFDELCMTEVFVKCSEGHFLKMMRYPEAKIEHEELSSYWKDIPAEAIVTEIGNVEVFMKAFSRSSDPVKFSDKLTADLLIFSELSKIANEAESIMRIDCYITSSRNNILELDPNYKEMQCLVNFGSIMTNQIDLK